MKNTDLTSRFQSYSQFLKWSAVGFGLFFWVLSSLGVWLGLFVLDNLLVLPPGLRLPLTITGIIAMGVIFLRQILSPARRRIKLRQSALSLEKRLDIPENLDLRPGHDCPFLPAD